MMTIAEFAEAAYQYAVLTGASQSSGYRSSKHNQNVGGKKYSPHIFGRAQDVVYDDPTMLSDVEKRAVNTEIAKRLGLFLFPEGDHDHLQPLDWTAG